MTDSPSPIDLRHFEAVCDGLGVALFVVDRAHCCVYLNDAARALGGHDLQQLCERPLHEVLRQPVDGACRPFTAAHGSDARPVEDVFVHRDGRLLEVEFRARALSDGDLLLGTVLEVHEIGERKQREAALRDTNERFRLVNRATNDVIWDWDLRTDRLQWNDAVEQHFGDPREALGDSMDSWHERIHPDDRERVCRDIARAIESGQEVWSDEYSFRKADGSYARFFDRGVISRDESGTPVRMIGSMLDLSERRRAEQSLQRSEQRYRRLADAMPQLVWTADENGVPDYYNARIERYRGASLAADGSWIWQDMLHPDDLDSTAAAWREALRSGQPYSCEHRLAMADGSHRWHLSRAEPAFGDDGRVIRWFGTATDIDAQRDSEQRFRALADNISQLAWMTDAQGEPTWFNRRWFEFTGSSETSSRVGDWNAVLHPEHAGRVRAKLAECLLRGEPWEDIFPMRAADGSYRWFLSRALPIRDAGGRISRWFGTHTDVTEQRRAEAALRDADRRKDDFLAMLAHELRNPLAPIRNALQILREPAPATSLERARQIIDRQVGHMVRLVDELLDVSRIARGRIELRSERCDLGEIVRLTAEDYSAGLHVAGLSLQVDVPDQPVWITGDRTRLTQVLGNLLHNAGKFTAAGGQVQIALRGVDGHARLSVSDNGCGIEPALLDSLFDPFSQAEQGLARPRGGLGLGLALVKGLVRLHGGDVRAHSDGIGRGARIELTLPLGAAPGDSHPAAAPDFGGGLRLLIVEDNRDSAETLRMLLALRGHEAEVVHDGAGALASLRRRRPDAVICDIGLDGPLDGYDVARGARADPALADLHLIALSGYGQASDLQRSREAGFDLHLIKPVQIEILQAALASVGRPTAGADRQPQTP